MNLILELSLNFFIETYKQKNWLLCLDKGSASTSAGWRPEGPIRIFKRGIYLDAESFLHGGTHYMLFGVKTRKNEECFAVGKQSGSQYSPLLLHSILKPTAWVSAGKLKCGRGKCENQLYCSVTLMDFMYSKNHAPCSYPAHKAATIAGIFS